MRKDTPTKKKATAKTEPTPKPKPKPVRISATRLRQVSAKAEIMSRHGQDALDNLNAMLEGKDPERSPVIAQTAAVRDELRQAMTILAGVPTATANAAKEVEGLL